jgi:hypothetical protein
MGPETGPVYAVLIRWDPEKFPTHPPFPDPRAIFPSGGAAGTLLANTRLE